MPPKKAKIDYANMAAPKNKWREDGPEQKQLERMFQNKNIDASAAPNKVRHLDPIFMAFPAKVFAAHFRKTKAKFGYYGNAYNYFT
jgi:hypothetical protein